MNLKHPLENPSFEMRVTPTKAQLFMFSAVTWNRHQIHYNSDQAHAEGFPDVAVQRGLLGNFLARAVTGWASAGDGRLTRVQWKVVQSAFPGQELRCVGEVTGVEQNNESRVASCVLKILNPSGDTVATGEATVSFK